MNTDTQKPTFTQADLEDFDRFEEVRSSGQFNMLDPNARIYSGLSTERYSFVMKNYSELRKQRGGK